MFFLKKGGRPKEKEKKKKEKKEGWSKRDLFFYIKGDNKIKKKKMEKKRIGNGQMDFQKVCSFSSVVIRQKT